MSEPPSATVIIPTYQRRDQLARALASLRRQTVPDSEYEVVAAVDGSTDGTLEMLARRSKSQPLRVVSGPRRGRAGACNAGLRIARGEVVILLDDDMEVVPQFIERHRRHHPPGSRRCVVGAAPVRLRDDSPLAARYVKRKFDEHLRRLARPGHLYAPRDFYSGNASLRAETLRAVGSFDESFTAYGNEDVELWLRLQAAEVEVIFDGQAVAFQAYVKDLRGLARDNLAKGGTAVELARAHPHVFGQLRLASPYDNSRPWLVARALLLALTRRHPATSEVLFAASQALERLGGWRSALFYRAVLDYAFWAGVDGALTDDARDGDLGRLADQLRRGPLELLTRP